MRPSHRRLAAALLCALGLAEALAGQKPETRALGAVPAPVGPQGSIQELYTGSYALLIGVSRYDRPTVWRTLDNIPAELDGVAAALLDVGFDKVEQVRNPTSAELRDRVEGFIEKYGYAPGHRLVFFFSGHGYTLDDGARGYFVPRDAPDPTVQEATFRRLALSMDQVDTWARGLTARHALFSFDSCFSGMIFRTRDKPLPGRISAATAKPVREFLSAGEAGEPVPAKSVFAHAFIRGLKGEADLDDDGYVTGTELGNYVQREVIAYKTNQTPQFGIIRRPELDEGDLVFKVGSTTSPAAPQAVEYYFAQMQMHEDEGRYEEAEKALMKAREVWPNDPRVHRTIGRFFERLGDFAKTMEAMHRAADLEPNNPEGFHIVATYYAQKVMVDDRISAAQKREYITKGIEAADKALALNKDYGDAMVYKGILLRQQASVETDRDRRESLIREADELSRKGTELIKKAGGGPFALNGPRRFSSVSSAWPE